MQVALRLIKPPTKSGQDGIGEQHRDMLLKVAQSSDLEAFEALFLYFAPRIKSLMIKSGAPTGEAEDIAQDVMIKVWRKSAQYTQGRGAVSTWIFTIARNARIDRLRKNSSQPYDDIDDLDIPSDDAGAEEAMLANQQAQHVSAALAELPEEQRTVIDLAFLHDMPQSEIAARLLLPLGTVKSRMRLAYDKLRLNLEDLI